MRVTGRGRLLLAGGAAAALLLVAYVSMRGDGPAAPVTAPAGERASRTSAPQDVPVVDVKLELLKDRRAELAEGERNPFRFQPKPVPPEPPRGGSGSPATAPPVSTGPPPLPSIPLRFIGLVDAPTQTGRIAILSDGRGNVFYGKEGDIIEGRYKVLKIGTDTAELSYSDGRGRQTIRLSGQ